MASSYLHVLPLHVEDKMCYYLEPTCWPSLITYHIYFLSKTSPTSKPLHLFFCCLGCPSPLCLVTSSSTFADLPR